MGIQIHPASRVRRWRKCLRCGWVGPAGELKPVRYGAGHWHKRGGSLRRCPRCGFVGFTQQFPVVKPSRQGARVFPKW